MIIKKYTQKRIKKQEPEIQEPVPQQEPQTAAENEPAAETVTEETQQKIKSQFDFVFPGHRLMNIM